MALPASFGTTTVTGSYLALTGQAAQGTVKFSAPPTAFLKAIAEDIIIVPLSFTATLDVNGEFSIVLPVTDDPDVTPSFTYTVNEAITGPGPAMSRQYNVEIPNSFAGGTVDLSDLAPVGVVVTGSTALTKTVADAYYLIGSNAAADGEVPIWNATNGQWEPGAQTGGPGGSVESTDITDASAAGRNLLTAADASAQRALLDIASAISTAINAVVGAAPGTLDTLDEIANALGDDPNLAATLTAAIASKSDLTHTHGISTITADDGPFTLSMMPEGFEVTVIKAKGTYASGGAGNWPGARSDLIGLRSDQSVHWIGNTDPGAISADGDSWTVVP
jgi:hypothetical protein